MSLGEWIVRVYFGLPAVFTLGTQGRATLDWRRSGDNLVPDMGTTGEAAVIRGRHFPVDAAGECRPQPVDDRDAAHAGRADWQTPAELTH